MTSRSRTRGGAHGTYLGVKDDGVVDPRVVLELGDLREGLRALGVKIQDELRVDGLVRVDVGRTPIGICLKIYEFEPHAGVYDGHYDCSGVW